MLLAAVAVALSCLTLTRGQDSGVNFGGEEGSSPAPDSPASDPIPAEPGSEAANGTDTELNTRFFNLSTGNAGTDGLIEGGLLGAGLGAAGVLVGQQVLNPCGRRRRQTGDGSGNQDTRFFLGGSNCGPSFQQQGFNNPCGRRKRQISLGDEGGAGAETDAAKTESTNTKFFGSGNNCGGGFNQGQGFNQGGFNQGGFNQGGFNQGGFNQGGGFGGQGGFNQGGQGFNQGGFNQGGFNDGGFNQGGQGFNQGGFNQGFNQGGRCPCRCSTLTFTGPQGQREGACQSRDNTGRVWCYTTGFNNQCGDLQRSQRFPNNPWSYNACQSQC